MVTDVRRTPTGFVPAGIAAVAVAAQLTYPLTSGPVRDVLTVAIVVALAAAVVAHAAITRGPVVAAHLLAVTALPALAVEVLGVHTGIPFGSYRYTGPLGPRLFDVPVVIALAWTMLAWPAAVVARRLATGRAARIAVAAWALTAADLFLDPQLVASGHWRWTYPDPHLPGVTTVPLTNLAGWLVVSLVLAVGLQRLLDRAGDGDDRLPIRLYLWLWVGWTVALTGFLHLPAAAGWGALGMGVVAVPLLRTLR